MEIREDGSMCVPDEVLEVSYHSAALCSCADQPPPCSRRLNKYSNTLCIICSGDQPCCLRSLISIMWASTLRAARERTSPSLLHRLKGPS